jgi:vacuolar-type H+-ATPase subunit E/Vma4
MGLDQVIGEVRRDGETRAEAMLANARAEAKSIVDAAKAQAKATEAARLAQADKDSAAIMAQAQSRAESESRKTVLAAEAELRARLRASLLEALSNLPAKSRAAHLKALADKAQKIVPKGSVWGAASDADALSKLKTYTYGGNTPIAGGLVVESEDGQTRLDMSYETLLDEAWRDILKAEAALFQ